MNEAELVKVSAEAALRPFADLIQTLFGGSATEIGGMWQDSLKARRIARQVKLFRKLQTTIAEEGFEPKQIADKFWIPALQAASIEDDDYLIQQWSMLLANAACPDVARNVNGSFTHILQQLSKADAIFLNRLYDAAVGALPEYCPRGSEPGRFIERVDLGTWDMLIHVFADVGLTKNDTQTLTTMHRGHDKSEDEDIIAFRVAVANLVRLRMLMPNVTAKLDGQMKIRQEERYSLSVLGFDPHFRFEHLLTTS